MDINGSVNVNSQSVTTLRNAPDTSDVKQQATEKQKETQSVDEVTTQQPAQQAKAVNEDVVNARVSEHQSLSSTQQITADEALGSLVDIRV
ncbi:MAG: hypothetical protein V5786_05990 [Psychromonas sp.]